MSHQSISDEELEELCARLAALKLSDAQRALLDAVLRIAWDYVGSHESLEAEFDGCFQPGEAAAIMGYPGSPYFNSITKSTGPGSITRAVNP